jgi:hypothetical protein
MASMNTKSIEKAKAVGMPGITSPDNLVRIRMKESGKLADYNEGDQFTTDAALAAHYCDALGIAERVEPAAAQGAEVVENAPNNRAMSSPPKRPKAAKE